MRFFLSIILLFAFCAGGYAQSNRMYTRAYRDSVLHTFIGKQYPDFDLTLSDGRKLNSKTLKGKSVLVNIWFGGCMACLEEFPVLNELYDSLKNDTSVIFISVAREPKERIPLLQNHYHIRYPVASATPVLCAALNYEQGYPANIIIGPDGKIVSFKVEGYSEKRAREVMLGQWLPMMRGMVNK